MNASFVLYLECYILDVPDKELIENKPNAKLERLLLVRNASCTRHHSSYHRPFLQLQQHVQKSFSAFFPTYFFGRKTSGGSPKSRNLTYLHFYKRKKRHSSFRKIYSSRAKNRKIQDLGQRRPFSLLMPAGKIVALIRKKGSFFLPSSTAIRGKSPKEGLSHVQGGRRKYMVRR